MDDELSVLFWTPASSTVMSSVPKIIWIFFALIIEKDNQNSQNVLQFHTYHKNGLFDWNRSVIWSYTYPAKHLALVSTNDSLIKVPEQNCLSSRIKATKWGLEFVLLTVDKLLYSLLIKFSMSSLDCSLSVRSWGNFSAGRRQATGNRKWKNSEQIRFHDYRIKIIVISKYNG